MLPASHHVWHYNPLQFLLEYGRETGAFCATVTVRAYDEQGIPENGEARIESLSGEYPTIARPLGAAGVLFERVPAGRTRIVVELSRDYDVAPQELDLQVGGANVATFHTIRDPNATSSRVPARPGDAP